MSCSPRRRAARAPPATASRSASGALSPYEPHAQDRVLLGICDLLAGRLVVTRRHPAMSGHSKWSSIKHKKALKDARRGKLFTKFIKEITVAARLGGGDINANPRLRTAVLTARQNSMPTDNIDRAIKKGTGDPEGVTYDEVTYEGYGPGGVAILVHALTDNRNRTVADVRSLIQKYGGNLGASGSVGWMFQKCGLVTVERRNLDEDRVMEVALEAGADDVRESGDILEIVPGPDRFDAVKTALATTSGPVASAEGAMMAQA